MTGDSRLEPRTRTRWLSTLLALLLTATVAAAQEGPRLVATADTEGHLGPCLECPHDVGHGGLAKRATIVEQLRNDGEILLVDAGNVFFGPETAGEPAEQNRVATAYAALGYDAINLGYRDFRQGKGHTLALLEAHDLPAVSANVLDAETNQPLAQPFVVAERGGMKTVFVGVSEAPPGWQSLPHLRRQLEGIELRDPVEALREELPRASVAGDRVVLLYYGSATTLAALHEQFGDELSAIVAGGTEMGASMRALTPPMHGKGLSVRLVGADGAEASNVIAVTPEIPADAEMAKLVEAPATADGTADSPADDAAGGADAIQALPESADALREGPVSLNVVSESDVAGQRLVIESARLADEWQGESAGEGRDWLVLDLTVENDLPLEMAFGDRSEGEAMLVALKQNLYLLGGEEGATAWTPLLGTEGEGVLPDSFRLMTLGSRGRGEVAFGVPEDLPGPLQLRLYHDEFPPAIADLRGTLPPDPVDPAEAQPNGYAELVVHGVELPDEVDGEAPPAGTQWVVVDLRGRATGPDDAPAEAKERGGSFGSALGGALRDEDAEESDAPSRTKPALYLKADSHLQLLADGQWARTRQQMRGDAPPEPTFLPDRFTGGTIVFLAPDDAESLELVIDFPLLQEVFGPGTSLKPETVRFALQGEPIEPEAEEAMAVVEDNPLPLGIVGAEKRQRFGPHSAEAGRALLVLDARIRNASDEDGLYEGTSRFSLGGTEPLAMAGRAGVPLDEPILLPAQSRRAFKLVFDVPAELGGNVAVGYGGVSTNADLPITVGDAVDEAMELAEAEDAPAEREEMPSSPAQPEQPEEQEQAEDDAEAVEDFDRSWLKPGSLAWIGQLPGEVPLALDQPAALNVVGENAAVRLAVTGGTLQKEYDGNEAPDGQQYLVLSTRWQTLQPIPEPTRRDPHPGRPAYEANLREQLFLVYNDRRIITAERMRGELALPTGLQVPHRNAVREWQAQAKRDAVTAGPPPDSLDGELVYLVPEGELRKAALHLLDPVHGNVELPLLEPAEAIAWEPALPSAANRIADLGVYGFDVQTSLAGRKAGSDEVWLVVDLRGRSLRHNEADVAIDHVPLRWDEGYCQLVLDGQYPMAPDSYGFNKPLRFLPGATVGGRVGFLVPRSQLEQAGRVELMFDYHPTPMPGEALLRPEPARFVLKEGSAQSPGEPLLTIDDIGVRLDIVGIDRTPQLGSRTPPEGREWLVLNVNLTGTMPTGEWFNPRNRLRLGEGEDPAIYDRHASASTSLPPAPPNRSWWIPSGETRSMQLAWDVEPGATPPLWYTGLRYDAAFALDGDGTPLPGPAPEAPREPQGIAGVGLEAEQVNSAIDRGRDWLWQELQADLERGRALGDDQYHLPMLLALVHTKAHEEFPEFDSLLREYLAGIHPQQLGSSSTYKNGLLAMVIEGYGDTAFRPQLREVARYLVEDQGPDGAWNYNAEIPAHFFTAVSPDDTDEPAADEAEAPAALQVLGGRPPAAEEDEIEPEAVEDGPMRRRLAWEVNGNGDNSVSQFAVLGLLSCQRGGVDIEPEVWRRLLRQIWARQAADHGWGYTSGRPYGSMTSAGLGMAAIALNQLDPDADLLGDPRLQGGIGWLADNWNVGTNFPDDDEWIYYSTYGVERVGRLLGTEFIGRHEWYPLMAKWLVGQQTGTGAWPAGGDKNPRLSTTFALLFLTRATPQLEPPDADPEQIAGEQPTTGSLQMEAASSDPGQLILILDASGSMLAEIDGQSKFDIARDAVRSLIDDVPEGASVGLVVYGHRFRAIEDEADTDVELLIPPGPLDKAKFEQTLARLRPRGKTPLALSLDEAAKALGDGEATVVLLTDGGQGREPGDPVASAAAFARRNNVTLQIVGFDIEGTRQAQAWGEQLLAMAEAAGGQYLPANDAATLTPVVRSAITRAPGKYILLDAAGTTVSEGAFGGSVTLSEGQYIFRTTFGGEAFETTFWITPGQKTLIRFNADHAEHLP